MERNTVKYQDVYVNLATASKAGVRTAKIDIDTSYQRCSGMRLVEVSPGAADNGFSVGLEDNRGKILPIVHKTLLESNDSVAPDAKFLTLDFSITPGMDLKLIYKTPDLGRIDLDFFVQLRLEDPLQNQG